MKKSWFSKHFLLVFFLFPLSCEDSSSKGKGDLEIISLSIGQNDSLAVGAGIVVRFSEGIDLDSFDAITVEKNIELLADPGSGLPSQSIDYSVYKVVSSANVLLNGNPLTFWYDPVNHLIAFFEETTVMMPFGTGEGLIFNLDQIEIRLSSGLKSGAGQSMNEDYVLMINRSRSTSQIRVVPNPAFPLITLNGTLSPIIGFQHLPSSCQIDIYNDEGGLVKTIAHQGNGLETWDLNEEEVEIVPGIYHFEIVDSEVIFINGVFVIPAGSP